MLNITIKEVFSDGMPICAATFQSLNGGVDMIIYALGSETIPGDNKFPDCSPLMIGLIYHTIVVMYFALK